MTARPYVSSVTGGGVHPVAEQMVEPTGRTVCDGMAASVPFELRGDARPPVGGRPLAQVGAVFRITGPAPARARRQ